MTMNFLAILLSLAMMLTGVGGEGQPAEASKTLVLHDFVLTYGDETVALNPSLRLGASTDGQKAVFDLGVDVNGDTLFPIQLGVDDSGITALFEKNDVAVKVSAEALNALTEQANQMMAAMQSQMAQGNGNPELMSFLTQEFIPAYTGLIAAVQDPAFAAELQAKGDEIFAQVIDRGEGQPASLTIDGNTYDNLTQYAYTIEADQLAELCDAIYTSNEKLEAFYNALFKLYSMMPEESGLSGLTSFKDLFDKFGMDISLAVEEQLSEDKTIDVMDGVLTMDMSGMIAKTMQAQGTEGAAPEVPPIVMNIHSQQVDGVKDASVTCDYEGDANGESVAMEMAMTVHAEDAQNMNMSLDMRIAQNGKDLAAIGFTADNQANPENGEGAHSIGFTVTGDNGLNMSLQNSGISHADGTSEDNLVYAADINGQHVGVSFNLDVVGDAIEDKANGHEAAVQIDDLSQEAMGNLGQDQNFQAALMQASGSLMADAQTLTADESVQQLMGLFTAMSQPQAIEDYDYTDDSFEGEETGEYEYQEPEDDGVLAFNQPTFTWLPEGWELQNEDIDTAYDWVSQSFSDGSNYMYATFYQDNESNQVNYVVGEDGSIQAVEGREVSISDFGEGSLSVTIREDNVFGNLNLYGEAMDVETIGQIVAGIQF